MSVLDGKPNMFLATLNNLPDNHFSPLEELLECGEPPPAAQARRRYSFSRGLARRIGIVPALVMQFIATKVYKLHNLKDGKRWYYDSYREIASRYSFVSPITIYRAIRKLQETGLVEVGNHNRRKMDRTMWFHVTDDNRNRCQADLIYFSPEDALVVGIKAAIVYAHIQYTLGKHPGLLREGWLKVWPADLIAFQPLSKLEARSALRELVNQGYLEKKAARGPNCEYRLARHAEKSRGYGFEADPIENEARVCAL